MGCFKQSGVLKVESIAHNKKGEKEAPGHYTIKDEAVYTIVVKELINGKWVGYSGKDMQMEFVRIDPFVRITMDNKGDGKMVGNFKVPIRTEFTSLKSTITELDTQESTKQHRFLLFHCATISMRGSSCPPSPTTPAPSA